MANVPQRRASVLLPVASLFFLQSACLTPHDGGGSYSPNDMQSLGLVLPQVAAFNVALPGASAASSPQGFPGVRVFWEDSVGWESSHSAHVVFPDGFGYSLAANPPAEVVNNPTRLRGLLEPIRIFADQRIEWKRLRHFIRKWGELNARKECTVLLQIVGPESESGSMEFCFDLERDVIYQEEAQVEISVVSLGRFARGIGSREVYSCGNRMPGRVLRVSCSGCDQVIAYDSPVQTLCFELEEDVLICPLAGAIVQDVVTVASLLTYQRGRAIRVY